MKSQSKRNRRINKRKNKIESKNNIFFRSIINGFGLSIGFSFGIILLLILAYAGWHPASQIISGVFKGNYTFAGNVKFNKELKLPNVANVTCNSNATGVIAYNYSNGNYLICNNGTWYLTSLIPITNYIISIYNPNTESLSGFQVEVNISQVINNIGTNFEVELSNGSKVNYCFVQQNGECKANYNGTNKIWVKVPLLPENSTVNLTVVASQSGNALNGDKVFDFYDDFDENTLNTSKWVVEGSPNINLDYGLIEMSGPDSWGNDIKSKINFTLPIIIVAKINYNDDVTDHWQKVVYYCNYNFSVGVYADQFMYPYAIGGSFGFSPTVSKSYIYKINQFSDHIYTKIYKFPDTFLGNKTSDAIFAKDNQPIKIDAISDNYVDYIYVRKYAPQNLTVNVIQK